MQKAQENACRADWQDLGKALGSKPDQERNGLPDREGASGAGGRWSGSLLRTPHGEKKKATRAKRERPGSMGRRERQV